MFISICFCVVLAVKTNLPSGTIMTIILNPKSTFTLSTNTLQFALEKIRVGLSLEELTGCMYELGPQFFVPESILILRHSKEKN